MKVEDLPAHYQAEIREKLLGSDTRTGENPIAAASGSATRDRVLPSLEADLHDQVESFCREWGWWYLHSRMDRRTTVAVGALDFCIAKPEGRVLWLELKRRGGKATPAQLATIAHLRKLGHTAEIVDNWADAHALLLL